MLESIEAATSFVNTGGLFKVHRCTSLNQVVNLHSLGQ